VARLKALRVLCVNAGSSSLKLALHRCSGAGEELEHRATAARLGSADGEPRVCAAEGRVVAERAAALDDHGAALHALLEALDGLGAEPPEAAGHRLVHGGDRYTGPVRLDEAVLRDLEGLVPLAPLHLPGNLAAAAAVSRAYGELPQVACFDTAFHHRLPARAQRLPLPERYWRAGIRRYGFHGLSCEAIVDTLRPAEGQRTVIAHLGSGVSLTALLGDRPLYNTMGLTPAGGVMMGTRSGDLDPGVMLHLARHWGMAVDALDELVNGQSGLLGVSGITSDMQVLLARRREDPRAALAVDLFCDQLRMAIGALAALLGGVDSLVFTGGIGEGAAAVRSETCRGLEHLGIAVNPERNERHANRISPPQASCAVRVLVTDENRIIGRQTHRVLADPAGA